MGFRPLSGGLSIYKYLETLVKRTLVSVPFRGFLFIYMPTYKIDYKGMFPSPLGGLSIYLKALSGSVFSMICFRPLSGDSLFIEKAIKKIGRLSFPSPRGVLSIYDGYQSYTAWIYPVSVPFRGGLFIYDVSVLKYHEINKFPSPLGGFLFIRYPLVDFGAYMFPPPLGGLSIYNKNLKASEVLDQFPSPLGGTFYLLKHRICMMQFAKCFRPLSGGLFIY